MIEVEHELSSPALHAIPARDARRTPDGVCHGCEQHRPLFRHEQTVWTTDGAVAVDSASTYADLCVRCYSAKPRDVDLELDL